MQQTTIQIAPGYNDKSVTVHHPENVSLTLATVEAIKSAFDRGETSGVIMQPAYNSLQKETQRIEWFVSNLPGAWRIDNYGWTVVNRNRFDSFKARYDKNVFGEGFTAPANFRPVTAEEFARYPAVNGYSLVATKYAQLVFDNDGNKLPRRISCNLFLNDLGNGYAIEAIQSPAGVNWYRFELCLHEDTRTGSGKCSEEFTCLKCGRVQNIDSSD